MAEEASTISPPYATYRSFTSFINGLRETSIPSRIDRSVFGNMSGGVAYSILSALKFLKLIDELGRPQPRLHELVAASDEDRKRVIHSILRERYASLWSGAINLEAASSAEFDEHLRTQFGVRGSTVDKVAAFFIAAAHDAGIPLSVHLKQRRPQANSPSPRRRRSGRRQETENGAGGYRELPPADLKSQLVGKFPEFDPSWPDEIKASWFKGFQQLLDSVEQKATE